MHTNRRRVLQAIAAATSGHLLSRIASAAPPVPAARPPVGPTPPLVKPPPPGPSYPQSSATSKPIDQVLDGLAANRAHCSQLYLDTKDEHSLGFMGMTRGENHAQGLARTAKLADGSIWFFLTHSVMGGKGQLMQFRLQGPTQGNHPLSASPRTVAALVEQRHLDDQHPSDLVFLPDVGAADAGYVFVTKEYDKHHVEVFRWKAGQPLAHHGILVPFDAASKNPADWPKFIALDRVGETYYLAVMNDKHMRVYTAPQGKLFPVEEPGRLDLGAFAAQGTPSASPNFAGACQVKLLRDAAGDWFLLGFRADPSDDPNGADYVDVYRVQFPGGVMSVSQRLMSKHVFMPSGDTGFASTGTHFVEPSGRVLVSSSYRWAKDEGPGGSSYVSRVDECPSEP